MLQAAPLRVFFDADVLIAGSRSTRGASHFLLRLSESGLIRGVISEQVHSEARGYIQSELPAGEPAFETLVQSALEIVADPLTAELPPEAWAAPDDAPILAAALQNGCDFLVTFNVRHYRAPGLGLQITRPGPLVAQIRQKLAELGQQQ